MNRLIDRIFRAFTKGPERSRKSKRVWNRTAPEGCKSRLGTFTREPSWERASCRLPTLFYYLLFRRTCAGRRIISETIGHYGKPVPVVYVYLRILKRKSNDDFIWNFSFIRMKNKRGLIITL